MFFNGNEKGINNNGLIYTIVEKVHVADVKKVTTENGQQIDYLHFLSKQKRLHKLERLLNSHVVNTQVVVTNFADDAEEVINCEYMDQSVWRNEMCFFLKNVFLSSFFSSEYANDIVREHQPRVISLNCKYDNKIYMSGSRVYLCVNDLTKLRLTSHRNVLRDRFKMSNVVLLDVCSGGEAASGKAENGKAPNGDATNGPLLGGEPQSGDSKLREKYRQFFTDMYTYPVDLIGIYNHGTDPQKFSEKLKKVLTLNGSKDAEVFALPVQWHECFYDASGKNSASKSAKGEGPHPSPFLSPNQQYNVRNNEMDNLANAFSMNSVADIYSSIFSNSSVNEKGAPVDSLANMYSMYVGADSGLDVVVSPNNVTHNEWRQIGGKNPVGMANQFNYLDIQTREKPRGAQPAYELDAGYIEREFLSGPPRDGQVTEEGDNRRGEQHNGEQHNGEQHNGEQHNNAQQNDAQQSMPLNPDGVVDLHDLLARGKASKKKKTYALHDKTFYVNYDSGGSSDVDLSVMLSVSCGAANGAEQKGQTGGSTLNSSTDGGILKKYLKGDHLKEEKFANGGEYTREGEAQSPTQRVIEKGGNKTPSEKRRGKRNAQKNEHAAAKEAKLRKIDKVLKFIKCHRNLYYMTNESVLQRERLYDFMSCSSEEDAASGITNGIAQGIANGTAQGNTIDAVAHAKARQDEIANYLVEYIGRILLDVKIDHKKNAHMLIKKERDFYQVQKIILTNGIISSSCIRDTCNFLIGQLVNRKARERRKLCYVVSFWGEYCGFIHFDKPSQEMCSQTCIHLFFFCSPETIYVTMMNTQDRVF
ncbi:hypothetical protein PVBG_02351 [Plasmodium vivax Brazil I]|uniref:Uncharacterized protein n=1 Tax=Plasmodium vivax (strain Brazil I) TaxID=1033975 RepID=A0A0J9SMK8_PLAV1|nr:hypothetical protein PVBG_02351 [Plasmodium vivax Brazil I]